MSDGVGLRRARSDVQGMRTTVSASLARNEAGRLRLRGIQVHVTPIVDAVEPVAELAPSGDVRATSVTAV
jgi:hypothetical protein